MKNTLSVIAFILMSICSLAQETNFPLSINSYDSDVYQENESLKLEIDKLKAKLKEANSIIFRDSKLISELRLELRIQEKDFIFAKNKFKKNIKSMENRFYDLKTNRFGFGASFGTTLDKELNLKPYLGIGITFNLIVF